MVQRIKRITNYEKEKYETIAVDNIKNLPDDEQAEQIADKFAQISQEYDELKDVKKSSVKGDVPAKLFKHFGAELAKPVTDVINCCFKQGIWPNTY